jgi:hypothetical protein
MTDVIFHFIFYSSIFKAVKNCFHFFNNTREHVTAVTPFLMLMVTRRVVVFVIVKAKSVFYAVIRYCGILCDVNL